MKVCPLIRIFSLAPEICPNVLLTEDVFYTPHLGTLGTGPNISRLS